MELAMAPLHVPIVCPLPSHGVTRKVITTCCMNRHMIITCRRRAIVFAVCYKSGAHKCCEAAPRSVLLQGASNYKERPTTENRDGTLNSQSLTI